MRYPGWFLRFLVPLFLLSVLVSGCGEAPPEQTADGLEIEEIGEGVEVSLMADEVRAGAPGSGSMRERLEAVLPGDLIGRLPRLAQHELRDFGPGRVEYWAPTTVAEASSQVAEQLLDLGWASDGQGRWTQAERWLDVSVRPEASDATTAGSPPASGCLVVYRWAL